MDIATLIFALAVAQRTPLPEDRTTLEAIWNASLAAATIAEEQSTQNSVNEAQTRSTAPAVPEVPGTVPPGGE